MRNLTKQPEPDVLHDNKVDWLIAYLADQNNKTNKYRYRHPDIKNALRQETDWKCVYCESSIGHNTPGDVKHKIPSSAARTRHFDWDNLTIACTECNRRKNAYYSAVKPFLDPYVDDVESRTQHIGPILDCKRGDTDAEITVKILELHNRERVALILKKIEKIEQLNDLYERYHSAMGTPLGEVIRNQLIKKADQKSEFSGMVASILAKAGII